MKKKYILILILINCLNNLICQNSINIEDTIPKVLKLNNIKQLENEVNSIIYLLESRKSTYIYISDEEYSCFSPPRH